MEPESSNKDMTAGIAQDGTDFSYFVKVGLGSEGKQVYMLVDSASGTSWVMGPNCTTEACKRHDSFGPDDSETIEMSDKKFSISYGTGKVEGLMAQDDIAVAGVSFKFQIGIADNASEDFEHYAFDGILGLSLGKGQTENFLDVMSADGDLKDNIFSVVLNRASDCDNKGEIVFGSIDEDKYSGDITYSDVISGSDAWAIEVGEVAYDGKKAGIGGIKAFIDTGSTYIYGPKDVAEKIHSVIPDAKSADGGLSYKIPCDSTKALTFAFSGVNYEISPKDWISPPNKEKECTSNIYGHDVAAGSLLLGATFVKNVYAVFDKDKERIGTSSSMSPRAQESSPVQVSLLLLMLPTHRNVRMRRSPAAPFQVWLGALHHQQAVRQSQATHHEPKALQRRFRRCPTKLTGPESLRWASLDLSDPPRQRKWKRPTLRRRTARRMVALREV